MAIRSRPLIIKVNYWVVDMNEVDALEVIDAVGRFGLSRTIESVCAVVNSTPTIRIERPENMTGLPFQATSNLCIVGKDRVIPVGKGDTRAAAALDLLEQLILAKDELGAHGFLSPLSNPSQLHAVTRHNDDAVTKWFAAARANPAALTL